MISTLSDLQLLQGISLSMPVYRSEVVDWVQEWRCFVLHGEILGIKQYEGSGDKPPLKWLRSMIDQFMDSDESKSAFALDIGQFSSGEWALARINQQNSGCKTPLQQVQGLRLVCAARRM